LSIVRKKETKKKVFPNTTYIQKLKELLLSSPFLQYSSVYYCSTRIKTMGDRDDDLEEEAYENRMEAARWERDYFEQQERERQKEKNKQQADQFKAGLKIQMPAELKGLSFKHPDDTWTHTTFKPEYERVEDIPPGLSDCPHRGHVSCWLCNPIRHRVAKKLKEQPHCYSCEKITSDLGTYPTDSTYKYCQTCLPPKPPKSSPSELWCHWF